MRIWSPQAGRGHPPRAGPAPAVPPLVAGEPRRGRKRRLQQRGVRDCHKCKTIYVYDIAISVRRVADAANSLDGIETIAAELQLLLWHSSPPCCQIVTENDGVKGRSTVWLSSSRRFGETEFGVCALELGMTREVPRSLRDHSQTPHPPQGTPIRRSRNFASVPMV